MNKTFHKRAGTSNHGTEYEILNIANMAINLVNNEEIDEFYISSNNAHYGAFDDIVVEVPTHQNISEVYAVQTKLSSRGNLSLNSLASERGNFSLKKYFYSWQNTRVDNSNNTKYILYTNLKLNIEPGKLFSLEGENFLVGASKMYPNHHVFDISFNTGCCYRFSVVKDGCYDENYSERIVLYEKFFNTFFLYVDQDNMAKLKRRVFENFKKNFGSNDTGCNEYITFLTEWGLRDGNKEALNKKWMALVIALKVLSSRVKPLSFNRDNDVLHGEPLIRHKILRAAIENFDITVFGKESYDDVKNLWSALRHEFEDLRVVNQLKSKYQLSSTFIMDISQVDALTLSIILWLMDLCPLILTEDTNISKALKLCVGKKFIILKDDSVHSFVENTGVFETLCDLKTKTTLLYNQLIQNFNCSLQGKEAIPLEKIVNSNEQFLNALTTDDLIAMCVGKFNIIETKEDVLSEPYIERSLLKNAIDIKILENITKETIVLLDCVSERKTLRNRFRRYNFIDIDDYLNAEKDHARSLSITIYVSEKRCDYGDFKRVCNKSKNAKTFHQFRVKDHGQLEWIRSAGDVDVSDVEKYKLSEYYYTIHERDLDSSEFTNVNLLVSDPGMGKSELMKSFKLKCFTDCVTIIIDPKDVNSLLKNAGTTRNYVDALKKFLLDVKYKMLSTRDKDLFRLFLERNKVIYVWDALDELSTNHRGIAINIIVELSRNCVQWVTSRRHLETTLQRKFKVLSLNVKKFDGQEQKDYVKKRLEDVSLLETNQIIDKIESSFVLIEHKDILGIPLQIFMLTELFRQDQEKYLALLNDFFLLTDLYKYFIQEKINILYIEKLGLIGHTGNAELFIQSQKDKLFEEYTSAALCLLFPDAILTKLGFQYEESFELIHKAHSNIGLVTEIKDQIPRFIHNSFAEYLAADYFTSKPEHTEILLQVLFDPQYNNVRFFFDLLLAGESKAHVAVLYKNFNFLKKCKSELLTRKDSGGRSVLHLACSWGQRYPELDVKHVGGKYIVDDEGIFSSAPEAKEYLETIDCLVEKCDISEPDKINKMTPREYARKTKCLATEMQIIMKQSSQTSIEDNHLINMLYYSAHYGYYNVFAFCFELFQQTLSVSEDSATPRRMADDIKNNAGMTLLCVAAEMGHVRIVEFLLKAGADINFVKEDGVSPLNAAAAAGHYEIVQFLIRQGGADINLADRNGFTPLHSASRQGNHKIVELLVAAGADTNRVDKEGFTPLNADSETGHYRIVEFLVEAGADFDRPNNNGFTPLNISAWKGHDNIVAFLFKAGADSDLVSKNGFTPLISASWNGHYESVKVLVKAGLHINLRNKNGFTPLNAASWNGHKHIVDFLVDQGADMNLPNKNDFTPLTSASWNGHVKIVKLLLSAGAEIDPAHEAGFAALNAASSKGHYAIVGLLVEAGADINLPNKYGNTPLNAASWNGYEAVVDFLLKAGAEVNFADKDAFTPLFAAARNGHDAIVELLVAHNADINRPNKHGDTPLHAAAVNGDHKIVELLVGAGAEVNVGNNAGDTALHATAANGDDDTVGFLVRAGAEINLANTDGFTPLNAASSEGHYTTVELLVEAGADINLESNRGDTPLISASRNRHDRVVEYLVNVAEGN